MKHIQHVLLWTRGGNRRQSWRGQSERREGQTGMTMSSSHPACHICSKSTSGRGNFRPVQTDIWLLQTICHPELKVHRAHAAAEHSRSVCTPADPPGDNFSAPPRLTLQSKHRSAVQLSAAAPSVLLVSSTITFIFAVMIRWGRRAELALFHQELINCVWGELSGPKRVSEGIINIVSPEIFSTFKTC